MPNHETDLEESEDSYQSEDSDINFIPGYIIGNSEFVENSEREFQWRRIDRGIAYREEPLADEEWLANYNQQENERLELKEKLGGRLDGSVQLSEW